MKRCSKCGEEKPVAEFHKKRSGKDGRQPHCKACRKVYAAAHSATYGPAHRPETAVRARRYRQRHPGRLRAAEARWQAKHPEALSAKHAVYAAIRRGDLTRPSTCERCGAGGATNAHHADYSRPLDVVFLCGICHKAEHKANKVEAEL